MMIDPGQLISLFVKHGPWVSFAALLSYIILKSRFSFTYPRDEKHRDKTD